MFVTNWISTTKIQKISEITNFFRHYFLSRTEVNNTLTAHSVTIGQSDGIHTEIIKGLKKGQKIVTEIIVNTPEENEEPQQSQGLISGPGPRGKKK
ncbi:hypothetical protein [Segatella copri]|uniref:hypothetical protein n=1 Tax=Segatella copri TaxID=165179 RepID=UPI002FF1D74B